MTQKIYGDWNAYELAELVHKDKHALLPVAIADANDIRRALAIGDGALPTLPAGRMGDGDDCVLARALSNGWKATVSEDESALFHPQEGKTEEDVLKSVEALEQLGFLDVEWGRVPQTAAYSDRWVIEIPHTWAMSTFISMFDEGRFPELILGNDTL